MNFGQIKGESFADYLAADAVGSHKLADLSPRPLVYFKKHVERSMEPRGDSEAFKFGRLFHCLALEGEGAVAERYATIPQDAPKMPQERHVKAKKPSHETLAAAEWWTTFTACNAGKDIVSREDIDLAWRMVRSIRSKPAAVKLLARGAPEITFRHQLERFPIQARVDWFDGEDAAGPLCINVKTVESLDYFDAQYERFAYYKGDAFYRMVVAKVLGVHAEAPQMVNLVVEKSEPFECSIRIPDAQSLDIGAREVLRDLQQLRRCYETGVWPGEPDEARGVSLPEWKIRRAEAEAA